jgi:uncharacterized protein (TIGR03437 family)
MKLFRGDHQQHFTSTTTRTLSVVLLFTAIIISLRWGPAATAANDEAQTLTWEKIGDNLGGIYTGDLFMRDMIVSGSTIFAGTDGFGTYYSDNGGQLWHSITDGHSRLNRGPEGIVATSNFLFIATVGGVWRSNINPPYALIETNTGLQTERNNTQVGAYALVQKGSAIFVGTTDGIYRTTNNGQSWDRKNIGLISGGQVSFYVDGNVIYAGSENNAAYRSLDNGEEWNWVSNGLQAGRVNGFVRIGGTLLAATGYEGVFRSVNDAQSWTAANNGLATGFGRQTKDIINVGNVIYLATYDGVYVSTNEGLSWQPAKTGLTGLGLKVNTIIPFNGYLYIGTEGGGAYRALIGQQPNPTPTPTQSPTPTPTQSPTPTPTQSPTPTPTQSPTPTPTQSPTPTPTPNGRLVRVLQNSGAPGSTITVAVDLTSLGNENTVGYTLNFDPTVLTYLSSLKGTDAASILKNEASSAQGRVGIAATVDQGQVFSAGSRQLSTATFTIAANTQATSTTISLGDQPISRQVVGPDANSLTAGTTFGSGTINILSGGYEGDVTPRPTGKNNGSINLQDFVQIGRFAIGMDQPAQGGEFQRADCAPRQSKGDNAVNLADYVQAGRYAVGLDTPTTAGGPTGQAGLEVSAITSNYGDRRSGDAIPTRHVGAVVGNITGDRARVTFTVDSRGDENAIGWSLHLDPMMWQLVETRTSIDGAHLLINDSRSGEGRFGMALLLAPGDSLGAGRQTIGEATFVRRSESGKAFVIGFGDEPVARQIIDNKAQEVPASFEVGSDVGAKYITIVSAADLHRAEVSPASLATAFGVDLASETVSAETSSLPIELGGVRVRVRDSLGAERWAGLLFVSPGQINYQIPEETAAGMSEVEVLGPSGSASIGVIPISRTAPGLFSLNSSGGGLAAAFVYRTIGGQSTYEPIAHYDVAQKTWVVDPIDTSVGETYLVLFGSGIRGGQSMARAFLGGEEAEVLFAGPQGGYAGLDQVNLRLTPRFAGRGLTMIRVGLDGESSNPVQVLIK